VAETYDSGAQQALADVRDHTATRSIGEFYESERRARVDELCAQARELRRLDYEKDRELAEQAFELASAPGADGRPYALGMATALSLLAYRNCILGEVDLALSQAAQALGLLESRSPSVALGDLYDCVGWCHFCLGDYAEAFDYLTKAIAVADAIEDSSLRAYVLDSIGGVHAATGKAEAALDTQNNALALHQELGDSMGESLVLNNMAYTYLELGDYTSALEAAHEALRYAETEGRHHLRMWVLDTLADVYLAMGDAAQAERYAYRGLALAQEYSSETDEARGMMKLTRIACMKDAWEDALAVAEKAVDKTERKRMKVELYQSHELLSDVLEHLGDYQRALAHYQQFHELKQLKINDETESRLANMRLANQVDAARKDAEILRLRSLALEREVEERKVAQARLEARASLDALTGLYNRGHLAVLAEELHLSLSEHRSVSAIMFDVDRFKQVNDLYGHLAGDAVLVAISRELSTNARESDVPCRYGGDEFVMLLVGANADVAGRAAERLRQRIVQRPIRYGEEQIPVTISAGVASAATDEPIDLNELLERADRALYRAKRSGRNRVVTEKDIAPTDVPEHVTVDARA